MKFKAFFKSFSAVEWIIWGGSVIAITLAFLLCGNTDYLQLAASLVGACALILLAKGNVIGQFLCVAFAVFYAVISYFNTYYGEMIICLGMNVPIALAAIVAWLRHPSAQREGEVAVNRLKLREYPLLLLAALAVCVLFFFLLRALGTANLWWSTVSVFTSGFAMLLSVRRSPLYAFAYCLNDLVLIVLWALTLGKAPENSAMVVCFCIFLINDAYGLANWLRMRKRQEKEKTE